MTTKAKAKTKTTKPKTRYVSFLAEGSISSYRVWDGDREVGEVHLRMDTGAWAAWTPLEGKVMGSPFKSRRAAVDALREANAGKRNVRYAR